MRHYVLTRSAYGPGWASDANRRRLAITAGVTVEMMRRQTRRDWTWLVLFDRRDELLAERMAVFESAGVPVVPILWMPTAIAAAPWDKHGARTNQIQKIAATAYRAPWAQGIGPRDEQVLMTRLDDDDGLATDALERMAHAARRLTRRAALMLPMGYRVWAGRSSLVRHDRNAMHTLSTPAGDELVVYDYGHMRVHASMPVVRVDERPGWLWVRHQDTISGWKRATRPITLRLRQEFPIDWSLLA